MTGNWYNVSRPESYTYYYYGFVTVDLNLTQTNHSGHGSCPQSDPDIAGIGVVTSFLIAGVMTTALSITAAILESMINEENGHIHLPKFLHNRIARGVTDRQRESCIFWREVLERLILNLADQQLITGFSLLIIAYIVQPSPVTEAGKLWPARLSLVIYLSCLSSSSHLACMLTLQKYLKLHPALAKLRIFFIILFAVALSISIGLGQTFSVVGYILNKILAAADSKTAYNLSLYIGNGLLYGFPPAIALHVYWTAVLQLLPDTKRHIKEVISRMYHSWGHKLVPGKMLRRILGEESAHQLRRSAKATLWWLIFFNPPMIFAMQVIYANISLVFVLLQKFGGPSPSQVCWDPAECDLYFMCKGLDNEEENKWGFGQMLAMFVLLLPFLAAVETYQELNEKHRRAMQDLQSVPNHPHSPPTHSRNHSRSASDVALLPFSNPYATSSDMPASSTRAQIGRTRSSRSEMTQYTLIQDADAQVDAGVGRIAQLPRTYLSHSP